VLLVIGLASAFVGVVASLPGVGDAPARVEAILLAHGSRAESPPPPARLAASIVAVEDAHFYDNVAVNVLDGAARAALATLHTQGDPGGSTIPQQLAKALYGNGSASFTETLREIGLGVRLSLRYSDAQVLGMYLNAIYYGNGYWGDIAAAEGYFGVPPRRLSWAQASMLAGLPEAPSAYDPLLHLGLARERQRHVLDRLVATHVLSAAQADRVFAEPLGLR